MSLHFALCNRMSLQVSKAWFDLEIFGILVSKLEKGQLGGIPFYTLVSDRQIDTQIDTRDIFSSIGLNQKPIKKRYSLKLTFRNCFIIRSNQYSDFVGQGIHGLTTFETSRRLFGHNSTDPSSQIEIEEIDMNNIIISRFFFFHSFALLKTLVANISQNLRGVAILVL